MNTDANRVGVRPSNFGEGGWSLALANTALGKTRLLPADRAAPQGRARASWGAALKERRIRDVLARVRSAIGLAGSPNRPVSSSAF